MKIIRKLLILSFNYDWADDLKVLFDNNPKMETLVACTRTVATKLLSENEFDLIVLEETYKLKNMDYLLRVLTTLKRKPRCVYFLFSDFSLYKTIEIPKDLDICYKALSLPLSKKVINEIVNDELFPYGATDTSTFDREFMSVLIRACQNVITSFNITELRAQKPIALKALDKEITIRGKIILKNQFFKGSILVSFPKQSFLNLSNKVLNTTNTEIDNEIRDFAGELTNMIYGQAKKELEENGIKLDMAIPIVDESSRIQAGENPIYVIPFDSSIGEFFIKLAPGVF